MKLPQCQKLSAAGRQGYGQKGDELTPLSLLEINRGKWRDLSSYSLSFKKTTI
jgi:hypothetical protein